jgi:PII-like signaling protein
VLDDVEEIHGNGLVTLERARLLTGEIDPVALPEELHEATKLTIYVGRQERVYRTPAFAAITDLLCRRGIAGATVLLGVDGTAHGVRERARFFARNSEVPVMIIAVGSGEQIARILPELGALLRRPLLTLERLRVCKRDGQRFAEPQRLPATDEHGLRLWQKLMVYTSEAATFDGHPMHQAIVQRLRQTGASGATTLRGVWGFHGDHAPHGDRLLQLRRNVPVVTIVVDDPDRIARSFEIVDGITHERGLVTSEMVPALAASHEARRRGELRLSRQRF